MFELRGRCWSVLLSGAIGQRTAVFFHRRVETIPSKGESHSRQRAHQDEQAGEVEDLFIPGGVPDSPSS